MLMKPYLLPRVKNTSVGRGWENDDYHKYHEHDDSLSLFIFWSAFGFCNCISNLWIDFWSSDSQISELDQNG